MNGGTYDLQAYNRYRAGVIQENAANTQAYEQASMLWQQQAAMDIQNHGEPLTDDPEPPTLYAEPPAIPPSFDPNLMPELGDAQDFPAAMHAIDERVRVMHNHLKDIRRTKYEEDWSRIEAAFNMDEGMRDDAQRRASIQTFEDDMSDAEKGRWRMGACLPLLFEACEHIYSRLYLNVRGSGQDYCDIIGREQNDIPDAKRAVAFLNYQYSHEIPTDEELSDWCYDAAKLGTGFLLQYWRGNQRVMESISPWNIWIDNARCIERSAYAIVRKMTTVGDLRKMRDNGIVWFTDEDMETAANASVNYVGPDTKWGGYTSKRMTEWSMETSKSVKIDPSYQKVAVDTFFDTANQRQIVRVNETLVIGVHKAILPDRLPISVLTPRRRGRELYGDSDMIRILDSQDFSNALMEIMLENAKASGNPVWLTNDSSLDDKRLTPGYCYTVQDPAAVRPLMPPNNTQQIFYAIDWIRQNAIDRASGVNDTMRGQAQYSGMTATATRDLSLQAGNRIAPQEKMAIAAMKDVNTVALELCQLYLQPHDLFRVVGEQWLPVPQGMPMDGARPIQAQDLLGVAGKDLVPTGSPGTPVGLAQEYLNFATVVMQTGGNPVPIMREYGRIMGEGRINIDEIYPENGIGNDPMQENENLMQGKPLRRDPDDNDIRHMQVHEMMIADKNFQKAASMNPALGMAMMAHIQEHMMFAQRQAAAMAGAPMPEGMGSGAGTSGLNMQMMGPDAKTDGEREAQMEAQS